MTSDNSSSQPLTQIIEGLLFVASEPVAVNIGSLQVALGIDNNADNQVDVWAASPTAAQVAGNNVIGMRITVLGRTDREVVDWVEPAVTFEQACQSAAGFSILPWEGEEAVGLRAALQEELGPGDDALSVNLFIGPEGGFASGEVEFARSCGVMPVTLGSRVLRAETAGLVAASAILYECGDLDPPHSD